LSPNPKSSTSFEDILKEVQNLINPRVYRVKFNGKTIEAKQTIEWRASLSDRIVFKKAKTTGIVKTISISKHESGDENWLTKITPFINAFFKIKE
jgi:predicted nucleic-acid-binding protein